MNSEAIAFQLPFFLWREAARSMEQERRRWAWYLLVALKMLLVLGHIRTSSLKAKHCCPAAVVRQPGYLLPAS
jgi:hypothetical protein